MDGERHTGRRLVFRANGSPAEVLEVERFAIPPLRPGEVRIRVLAAPINPADLNTIEGTYGVKPPLPATPGIEGYGTVESSESGDFSEGDGVIFLRRAGSWASHVTMPADTLFKVQAVMDPLQAAMLKVNPATAWRLLHTTGHAPQGLWVVQNAGNSAVGRCVIQLARERGVKTISFVRRPELAEELRDLGADEVFTDDADGLESAQNAMGGAEAVLAFNAVGGDSALRLMKLLAEGATHVTYGAMGRRPLTVPNGPLIFRDIRLQGLWVTRWLETAGRQEVEAVYRSLAERVAAGKLHQPVDTTFPFENFAEALARLEAPERNGKVLFVP